MSTVNHLRESVTMSFSDLYTKVNDLPLQVAILDTKFAIFFVAGVIFWGAAQVIIFRKLDQIDKTIEQVAVLQADTQLLKYQQREQDKLNSQLVNKLEIIQQRSR